MSNNDSHPALDDPTAYVLYRYRPSNVAAIIFVVVFGITTIAHIFQLFKKRTWYFIPLIVGGIFEVIGFTGRALSHNDQWALGPFIMQSLLILVAPALFAASIYIILGRIILMVDGEHYSLVRQKWLTKTFVAGDVASFLLQGGGGGIQAGGTLEMLHTGEKIIIGGLFVQLLFFAVFIVVAGVFHYRLVNDRPLQTQFPPTSPFKKSQKHRQLESSSSTGPIQALPRVNIAELPWKRHIYNLYFTSGLIMMRNIFRIAEYIQGNAGYLLSHEVFLYIFDAVLMLIVMVSFNRIHPSGVTEAMAKRQQTSTDMELQQTREEYMGHDQEHLVRNKDSKADRRSGGWTPSRY